VKLLISGYTDTVLLVHVDSQGKLEVEKAFSAPSHLSFLIQDLRGPWVYGVQESPLGLGSVWSFVFPQEDSGQSRPAGEAPCHLALSPDGKWLALANYTDGTVDLYPLTQPGALGAVPWRAVHEGHGPNINRQERAHAHGVWFTQDSRRLLVCDLGIDSVLSYPIPPTFAPDQGWLQGTKVLKTQPGDGPRHLVLNKPETYGYLVNELSSTVEVYSYQKETSTFGLVQRISSLPEGLEDLSNTAAEIALHPTEKFLYVSNRGQNTLACFPVDSTTGTLGAGARYSTQGKIPRHFFFDSTGRFLFVSNQGSDEVRSFLVDKETGELTWTGSKIEAIQPTCGLELRNIG